MAYHIYQTPGLIIDTYPKGEADLILRVFTRDLGMVFAVARGVRVMQSKLRMHLVPYSCGMFSVVRGREVWRVISSEKLPITDALIPRVSTRVYTAKLSSLLKRLLQGQQPDKELFDDVYASLEIAASSSVYPAPFLHNLECLSALRVLHRLGYIGDNKQLAPFVRGEWSAHLVNSIEPLKKEVVSVINTSLEASHI